MRFLLVLTVLLLFPLPAPASSIDEPLPIDALLSLDGHNGRSAFNVSPDGRWLAHTVESPDTVPRTTSSAYSDSGFPFGEGNARMEATLSEVDGDRSVTLGASSSTSWAPVWSPDGRKVAFYSDEGGTAGLWVWERDSGEKRRIGEFVVRPFFGFETVRWSSDSRRLLVKILPEDLTLEEANALLPAASRKGEVADEDFDPEEPTVEVRRSAAARALEEPGEETSTAPLPARSRLAGMVADLALVDVESGAVQRLVRRQPVRLYELAPDEGAVAYTVLTGMEPNSQQPLYDLRLVHLSDPSSREEIDETVLAEGIRLGYGTEWSWSPDGRHLAYFDSGHSATGELVLVPVAGGEHRVLTDGDPAFGVGEGEVPPRWTADGSRIWGISEGALWEIAVADRAIRRFEPPSEWRASLLVAPTWRSATPFAAEGGASFWLVARSEDALRRGLPEVDVASGKSRVHFQESASWSGLFSVAASEASGDILLVSRNQQRLGDAWAVSSRCEDPSPRRVTDLNPQLGDHALGQSRLISWTSARGEDLRGALLLPPDHREGQRHPLVVWVYGGADGSHSLHRFGFWGASPALNMHILATRGYAVLYPDTPLRTGHVTEDLLGTVLPGVDAAVEQGFADPERLAVMGQSYGSLNVLSLITRTDRFDAAVITAAVLHPDLFADYLTGTGYYEQGQGNMGGSIWEHPDRYRENSPLFDFPQIEAPLLIGQGALDGDLVPAEAIFTALDRLGKVVEYRLYEGEGHVLTRRANVEDFWRRRLEFLERHLDGSGPGTSPDA